MIASKEDSNKVVLSSPESVIRLIPLENETEIEKGAATDETYLHKDLFLEDTHDKPEETTPKGYFSSGNTSGIIVLAKRTSSAESWKPAREKPSFRSTVPLAAVDANEEKSEKGAPKSVEKPPGNTGLERW